jgi:hypothetical protein
MDHSYTIHLIMVGGGIFKCKIKLYIDIASTNKSTENYSEMTVIIWSHGTPLQHDVFLADSLY